jgi:hypothetical protein
MGLYKEFMSLLRKIALAASFGCALPVSTQGQSRFSDGGYFEITSPAGIGIGASGATKRMHASIGGAISSLGGASFTQGAYTPYKGADLTPQEIQTELAEHPGKRYGHFISLAFSADFKPSQHFFLGVRGNWGLLGQSLVTRTAYGRKFDGTPWWTEYEGSEGYAEKRFFHGYEAGVNIANTDCDRFYLVLTRQQVHAPSAGQGIPSINRSVYSLGIRGVGKVGAERPNYCR